MISGKKIHSKQIQPPINYFIPAKVAALHFSIQKTTMSTTIFLPNTTTDLQAASCDYETYMHYQVASSPNQFPLMIPGKTLQMILPLYRILKKIISINF
jgi:hypothetical protein